MTSSPPAPRIQLARLPTPVERLEPLSREFGVHIHVKRDDLTGAELSGNKVRKLEYLLPQTLEAQADVLITCGAAQSNHCRAVAICARRLGLDVELFLRAPDPASAPQGNLLLSRLMGAMIHPVSLEAWGKKDALMAERADELESRGHRAYVIPEGGSNALGALGYVRCMEEIVAEERRAGQGFDLVVAAAGSGGTLAGLLAGAEIHGCSARVVGVPVCEDAQRQALRTDRILDELRQGLTPELRVRARSTDLLDPDPEMTPEGPTDRALERIRDVATLTGLVLDPVYTNQAFGGLLNLLRNGALRPRSSVLFIHTGGLYGLFPFAERLRHLI